jgi:hypothetical protein
MMTKKEYTKSLLKGHICNRCWHCFDNDQICWADIEIIAQLPKEYTCEKFKPRS